MRILRILLTAALNVRPLPPRASTTLAVATLAAFAIVPEDPVGDNVRHPCALRKRVMTEHVFTKLREAESLAEQTAMIWHVREAGKDKLTSRLPRDDLPTAARLEACTTAARARAETP